MGLLGIKILGELSGGSRGVLMLCSDSDLWVVKLRGNPQHLKVLANDYIGSRILATLGLNVPNVEIVTIASHVITQATRAKIIPQQSAQSYEGPHFASRYVGGLLPDVTFTALQSQELSRVSNLTQFAGVLAADLWTFNSDYRQVIFQRKPKARRYTAHFIDQGHCLNLDSWHLVGSPRHACYRDTSAYDWIQCWDQFEPWLTCIETFSQRSLAKILDSVPPAWYRASDTSLEALGEQLMQRKLHIRELIQDYRPLFKSWLWTRNELRLIGRTFGRPSGCLLEGSKNLAFY